jgi:protein phosphatase
MYFHHAGLTDTGMLREHNEDDYTLPVQVDLNTLNHKGHLYVLADGMGGHQKGEVASAVTVEAVPSAYYTTITPLTPENFEETIIQALANAIGKANVDVMEATEGGGTTIVTAVLYEDLLVTMNVGDSRAYLLRGDELRLISRDHSLVSRLVEMGKITAEEALTHPRRNVLYQALGQGTDLEIHVVTEKIQMGDIITLCSDGLWGEIEEDALKQTLSAANSPQEAARDLVNLANQAGGADNITAIIIYVSDKQPPEIQYTTHHLHAYSEEDTQPTKDLMRKKPDTLPEGKYHTQKN